jgi:DNA-binding SARP family transcriptional activator/predicted ATPase
MGTASCIRMLGTIQIVRNGEPVSGFRSRKALAILGYLAVQNHPTPREQLVDMFWEDQSESRGRANLSWVLNHISSHLPDCLVTTRHSVQFQRAGSCSLDTDVFEELEAQGDIPTLSEAVELYRGDFLEGLYVDGCPEYEIWLTGERERWRQRVGDALWALISHHDLRDEYEQSLRFARRLLALNPWQEEAHRHVMQALARVGQRSAALAQYEDCRRVLAEELGVEPAQETRTLYERIHALASTRRQNLPVQPTVFVGREEELAEVGQLLSRPDCRLLTILGPGGIGKTRLALQAAEAKVATFLEGVYFVPLVAVSSTEFMVSAIADAVQFSLTAQDPRSQLFDYLRRKEMLLLLDGMEHLLDGTPLLSDILEEAPGVKLLVTSRERLNLRWERCFEIAGLTYPQDDAADDAVSDVGRYSALRLFQEMACRVRREFALSMYNGRAVTRVCQIVEGMPLGIELAAAWVGTHTCEKIAQEIERGLDFLTTSLLDVPERQRSLWAAFEHSWQLLTPAERDVLAGLSVFRRGFQSQAAEDVAGASPSTLESLESKSLLRLGSSGRYEMHEMVRQFANDKLRQAPETEQETRDRHCAFYAAFLQFHEADLRGADVRQALEALREEIGNIRAAWHWGVRRARIEDIERSLGALSYFYRYAAPFREWESLVSAAIQRVRALIAQDQEGLQAALGKLLAEQANCLCEQGAYEQSIAAAQEAIRLGQAVQDKRVEAGGHLYWAETRTRQGEFDDVRHHAEIALRLAQGANMRPIEVESLVKLGMMCFRRGVFAEAGDYYQEVLRVCREIGDRRNEANALNGLGLVHKYMGSYDKSREYHDSSLKICREIGERRAEGSVLNNLGAIHQRLGDSAKARECLEQALLIVRELGERYNQVRILLNLTVQHYNLSDYIAAKVYSEQALTIAYETDDRLGEMGALDNLGCILRNLGDYEQGQGFLEKSLGISREIDAQQSEGLALRDLGLLFCQAGAYEPAKRYSQEALLNARETGEQSGEGYALALLGHAEMGLGHLDESIAAYQQAIDLQRELGEDYFAIESLAGLARASAARGDSHVAQTCVEQILEYLETKTLDNTDEPFRVYLTCYRILKAGEDPRAAEILNTAYDLLQEHAAKITHDELRRSFLENVTAHREIVEAFESLRLRHTPDETLE